MLQNNSKYYTEGALIYELVFPTQFFSTIGTVTSFFLLVAEMKIFIQRRAKAEDTTEASIYNIY